MPDLRSKISSVKSGLFALLWIAIAAAHAGDCKRTATRCIDSTPSKNISGVLVTLAEVGGCWMYEDTYVCLKPDAVDYCKPLSDAGCWQASTSCVQWDSVFGTGCMKSTNRYRCDNPSMPTPPNTIRLEDSYTLVSSDYDLSACSDLMNKPGCNVAESVCLQTTPDAPLPPGISPTSVAPDGCYRREYRYACLNGVRDMGCAEYSARPDCELVSSSCDDNEYLNGQCLSTTKVYRCVDKRGTTQTVADCSGQQFCISDGVCFDSGAEPDSDFAKVVTLMEAMREAGTYLDENNMRLFNGVASRCTRKPLVNCCKAKSGSAPSNMEAVKALFDAAGAAYDFIRSPYMYDVLFTSSMPDWALRSIYRSQPMTSPVPSFSYMGFTAQYGTITPVTSWFGEKLGINAFTVWHNNANTFAINFDPVTFAFSLAVSFVLDELMSCDQEDILTGMRVGNNLCHYIDVYTSKKFPRERKQTYCCYNSRLAKIINVEGRRQLGKGWGSAKSPDCSGFTVA